MGNLQTDVRFIKFNSIVERYRCHINHRNNIVFKDGVEIPVEIFINPYDGTGRIFEYWSFDISTFENGSYYFSMNTKNSWTPIPENDNKFYRYKFTANIISNNECRFSLYIMDVVDDDYNNIIDQEVIVHYTKSWESDMFNQLIRYSLKIS